jgi:hypothetical protein
MTYSTEVQEDLNAAKYLLNKHGFAFKIFGRDDVIRVVRENYGELPISQEAFIVKHVMEGDDWPTMSDYSTEDESNLIAIIEGTQHDHPEWFVDRETMLKEKAKDWMYSHGQAILDDMADDIVEELEVSREDALEIIDLIERAELTIKF